jgi:hypothetical protein
MSQPPDDDTWKSVLGELNDALDSLNLRDGPERQSLLAGVKEAMENIFEMGVDVVVSTTVEPSTSSGPSVVVLDGGKEKASAQTKDTNEKEEKPRVQFKVVSEPAAAADNDDNSFSATTDIHVHRVDPRLKRPSADASTAPLGTIVTRTEKGSPVWQTLYLGKNDESYRIFCEQGVLEVSADDLPNETVHPRQSIDLQAKRIQVRSLTQDDARGVYCKITG